MNANEEFKILQPKYYSKFTCDPNKCLESCCERWKIIIDKNTYEKYIESENETIKGIVKTGLSINETSLNDDDFVIINLNNELTCPFLNHDNLCEIFINMGESSLSKTCKSYPRTIILVDDGIERGLEMSCSVAAETALLNEDGIEFEYVTDAVKFSDVYVVSPTIKDFNQIQIIKEIRTTVIEILQTRTIELNERVAIVGNFLNQILKGTDFSGLYYKEALTRIRDAKSLIDLQKFKNLENKHTNKDRQQFHHLNTILSLKFKEGDSISFFSKRYIDCLMQVLDTFGRIKDKELENNYKKSYEKYLKPYMNEKSYVLENFLVNYIFIYGVELFKLNEIWNSYLKLCAIYGLIKFNLIGLAAYHKGMNDDLSLKLIQSLSKTIITDKTYLEAVIKYLEENQLTQLTKVLMLIVD